MMNETNNAVMVRSLECVKFWEWNPRGSSYRGIEELMASLEREGLQDAIHVWERVDGDFLLKGHRRFEAMSNLGWTECKQVVHHFEDDAAAYRFLLEDHGHTDPLDAEEKIVAVEHGVKLGMTTAELAPCLGVSEERAQLWFDLGKLLPQAARSALGKGDISLNTAELLLDVPDAKDRRAAAQMILKDMETGEPMAHGQAKAYIQAHYVLPEKWRREWLETELKLKKKFKVADGHHYVEWAARRDYIMGESGQPEPEFEFATSFLPRDREGRTFGEVAKGLSVPIYVVPAPLHKDGYVALVQASMLRDAMSIPEDKETGRPGEEEMERVGDKPETTTKMTAADVIVKDAEEQMRMWLRTWLGAIYEALLMNPTDVMTKEPWLPLQEFLAHLTTDVDAGALHAWLEIDNRKDAQEWIVSDMKNRAHLRTTLMLLLCAESDSSSQPEKVIRAVAAALGVDGKNLDQKLGGNR
jgi:ParB-like chromosome segregation protein Spo0J